MKLPLAIAYYALQSSFVEGSSFTSLRQRVLSFQTIAGYRPGSQVTDHCAIDLDQAAIEAQLARGTAESFEAARAIYNEGGNSKSYAQVSLTTPLSKSIQKGDSILGRNSDGVEVQGKAYADYPSGTQIINVLYETTDLQESYMNCQVGALVETNMVDCFANEGVFNIDGDEYAYTYNMETDNKAARTIAGFSKQAEDKMLKGCPGCPYKDFKYFYDYYGTPDYAHQWIESAFDGESTNFRNGNADFGKYGFVGRQQVIQKGSAYMSVFMYVIREFEDALDDCQNGIISDNYNSVHAWDEGVCFYTGSLEGQNPMYANGKLLHALADKRCGDFKVCNVDGVDLAGMSKINYDLGDLFALGNYQLLSGNCPAARVTTERIIEKMYIPMIQGTLRYAYKVDKLQGGEKENAEGAVFSAAVLPRVHAANPQAAQTIYDNMKVGADSTDVQAVKKAFESVYPDLGINCADVGGFWNEGTKDYYPGMDPCKTIVASSSAQSESKNNTLAIALGCTFGGLFVIAAAMILYMRNREQVGEPVFKTTSESTATSA